VNTSPRSYPAEMCTIRSIVPYCYHTLGSVRGASGNGGPYRDQRGHSKDACSGSSSALSNFVDYVPEDLASAPNVPVCRRGVSRARSAQPCAPRDSVNSLNSLIRPRYSARQLVKVVTTSPSVRPSQSSRPLSRSRSPASLLMGHRSPMGPRVETSTLLPRRRPRRDASCSDPESP
jgi:hypothetical protein